MRTRRRRPRCGSRARRGRWRTAETRPPRARRTPRRRRAPEDGKADASRRTVRQRRPRLAGSRRRTSAGRTPGRSWTAAPEASRRPPLDVRARTDARSSKPLRPNHDDFDISLLVGSRSAPKFCPCVEVAPRDASDLIRGAGHIRSRAMGDESPPIPLPAPRDDRSRSPRLATTAVAPPRGDSPPRGRDYSRSRSRSPRRDDRRPPSRDRSPVTAAAADARPASPGDGTRAVSVRAANPESPLSSPFVSRAPATLPPVPTIRARPPFRANCHPRIPHTGSRARPPEKHARSSSRPSSPCSTVTSKRVATRRVDASSRTSSVRPHPHHS